MADLATEIIIIVLLVLVNGVFAMAEIALISVRKARLEQRAERGDERARLALALLASPERFLSTIQIGITFIGMLAGAFGGATIAEQLATAIKKSAVLGPYAYRIAIPIVVLAITYLSVVLGEIVPKRLASSNAEPIAIALAGPITILSKLLSPVINLLTLSTNGILRLTGLHRRDEPVMTEEELQHALSQATEAGVIESGEQELLERTMKLADRKITAFMTSRTEVVWLDIDASPEQNWRKVVDSRHSSFPLCDTTLDEIAGIVSVKRLWEELIVKGSIEAIDLGSVIEPPLFVLEGMPALKVLELLKSSKQPLAIVLDEYGAVHGLVTVQDFVASVFFGDPQGTEESMAFQREDGSWLISGRMPIEDFTAHFHVDDLPEEGVEGYATVGGFVMSCLGRIPQEGDVFTCAALQFEVVDLDGRRIDKVLAIPPKG